MAAEGRARAKLTDEEEKALDDLALENLSRPRSPRARPRISEERHSRGPPRELKGDEVELVGEMTTDKQVAIRRPPGNQQVRLLRLPRRAGFEDAKPIGTGLADWGRKTPDKLAFEQIVEYMKHGHGKPSAGIEPQILAAT